MASATAYRVRVQMWLNDSLEKLRTGALVRAGHGPYVI